MEIISEIIYCFVVGSLMLLVGFIATIRRRLPWVFRFLIILFGLGFVVYSIFQLFNRMFPGVVPG